MILKIRGILVHFITLLNPSKIKGPLVSNNIKQDYTMENDNSMHL